MADIEQNPEQMATQRALRERGQSVPVKVKRRQGDPAEAEVFVYTLSGRERAMRGLKMLGLFWLLALVSILLPVLHFVLVPLFAVVGPIAAWLGYRREQIILGGITPCPECAAPFDVGQGAVEWPLQAQCPGCRAIVRMEPVNSRSERT